MTNNNKINADLQRKVARQKQELTRAYEQLETQRETIRNLCKIRDEAKQMWFYIQGLETALKNTAAICFDKTETLLFGEASYITLQRNFDLKEIKFRGDLWVRKYKDNFSKGNPW
jgi:predicted RNase H-like nuclease (RuvC/YqgF family)